MRFLFILGVFYCFSTQAGGKGYYYKEHISVPKGTVVYVAGFSKNFEGVFRGYSFDFDGEGEYYFRAEHLSIAMNSKLKTVLKNAPKIVGKKITLKKELKTVLTPPSLTAPIITEKL